MIPLLEIRGLISDFRIHDRGGRRYLQAVRGVDMRVYPGEIVGLVGESGCGKSTLARCALRLLEPTSGSVFFDGTDMLRLPPASLRRRRREFQMIFQDPLASLDPRMTVGASLEEPFLAHGLGSREQRRLWVKELMESVALDHELAARVPGMLSGGQQQRAAIARALALKPRLVVADEPVSALDASVQLQILNQLAELQRRLGMGLLLISHSLAVVHYLCSRVLVMYLGKIVEESAAEQFFAQPDHPYSRLLLDSMPRGFGRERRSVPAGEIPSPADPPPGCAFHPRCPQALPRCSRESPGLLDRGAGRRVACFLY
jgi:peptide/nickel transport system ATP-binding protein/oligopeptide transport system ATP-binding protein